jgi:hypothetical protein
VEAKNWKVLRFALNLILIPVDPFHWKSFVTRESLSSRLRRDTVLARYLAERRPSRFLLISFGCFKRLFCPLTFLFFDPKEIFKRKMSLRMVRLVAWRFYLRGHVTWYKLRPTTLPEPGSCSFYHSSFSSFTLSTRLSTAHLSTIRWSQQSWASRSVSELRNRDFAHVLHFWCTVHFHKISPLRIVPRVVIIQQWVRSYWKVAIIGRGETDTKFCTSIMTSTILVLHTHRPGPHLASLDPSWRLGSLRPSSYGDPAFEQSARTGF